MTAISAGELLKNSPSNASLMPSPVAAVVTIPLDSLGDSITTATVVTWHKRSGDAVAVDDAIATVDTDKVSVDIKAKAPGVFGKGLIEEGAEVWAKRCDMMRFWSVTCASFQVSVGADLYTMDTDAVALVAEKAPVAPAAEKAPVTAAEKAPSTAAASSGERLVVPVPIMGESITTGSLADWSVKVGDSVDVDQVVAVIDTDKVSASHSLLCKWV